MRSHVCQSTLAFGQGKPTAIAEEYIMEFSTWASQRPANSENMEAEGAAWNDWECVSNDRANIVWRFSCKHASINSG